MCNINILNKNIHKKITELLRENRLTQAELAEKVKMTSPSVNRSLKNLEKGKSILTETLFKFADGLGVEVAELLR